MKLLSLGAMFSLALTITACGGPPFEIAPDYAITLPGTLGSDPAADAGDPAVDGGDAGAADPVDGAVTDSAVSAVADSGAATDSGSADMVDAGEDSAEPAIDSGKVTDHDAAPDCPDGGAFVTHTDGQGQTFLSCAPLGSGAGYSQAGALLACAAYAESQGLPASDCQSVTMIDDEIPACVQSLGPPNPMAACLVVSGACQGGCWISGTSGSGASGFAGTPVTCGTCDNFGTGTWQ